MYEILKAGGFTTGGFNFDAKIRRQSTNPYDLFHAHIGAIDVLALSLKRAAKMLEDQALQKVVDNRYAGWNQDLGLQILNGKASLEDLAKIVETQGLDPKPVSGQQEYLENLVNSYIYR